MSTLCERSRGRRTYWRMNQLERHNPDDTYVKTIVIWQLVTTMQLKLLVTWRLVIFRNTISSIKNDTLYLIYVLPWPAVSSDLSLIEQGWDEMQRRLHGFANQFSYETAFSASSFESYGDSLRWWYQVCVDAKGGQT